MFKKRFPKRRFGRRRRFTRGRKPRNHFRRKFRKRRNGGLRHAKRTNQRYGYRETKTIVTENTYDIEITNTGAQTRTSTFIPFLCAGTSITQRPGFAEDQSNSASHKWFRLHSFKRQYQVELIASQGTDIKANGQSTQYKTNMRYGFILDKLGQYVKAQGANYGNVLTNNTNASSYDWANIRWSPSGRPFKTSWKNPFKTQMHRALYSIGQLTWNPPTTSTYTQATPGGGPLPYATHWQYTACAALAVGLTSSLPGQWTSEPVGTLTGDATIWKQIPVALEGKTIPLVQFFLETPTLTTNNWRVRERIQSRWSFYGKRVNDLNPIANIP